VGFLQTSYFKKAACFLLSTVMDFKVKSFILELTDCEAKSLFEEISMIPLESRGSLMDQLLWKIKDYYDNFIVHQEAEEDIDEWD